MKIALFSMLKTKIQTNERKITFFGNCINTLSILVQQQYKIKYNFAILYTFYINVIILFIRIYKKREKFIV